MSANVLNLRCIVGLTMLLLAMGVAAALPQFDGDPNPNSGTGEEIPIELSRPFGLVLVKAEVNGRPARLLLDTGSSHTILNTQLVQARVVDLGGVASPSKGTGWVGRAAWTKATVKVGDTSWSDHRFLAMDDLPDISSVIGQKIDGILGEDILKDFAVVEIDFKRRHLVLVH